MHIWHLSTLDIHTATQEDYSDFLVTEGLEMHTSCLAEGFVFFFPCLSSQASVFLPFLLLFCFLFPSFCSFIDCMKFFLTSYFLSSASFTVHTHFFFYPLSFHLLVCDRFHPPSYTDDPRSENRHVFISPSWNLSSLYLRFSHYKKMLCVCVCKEERVFFYLCPL